MPSASGPTAVRPVSLRTVPFAAPPRTTMPAPASAASEIALMLAFDRRIGDLEHIEHSHRDVITQVGKCSRHADEPDLAGSLELEQRVELRVPNGKASPSAMLSDVHPMSGQCS